MFQKLINLFVLDPYIQMMDRKNRDLSKRLRETQDELGKLYISFTSLDIEHEKILLCKSGLKNDLKKKSTENTKLRNYLSEYNHKW